MISIIIPCYNGEEWLGEAIESVLIQRPSYDFLGSNRVEIVVVDDGSQDKSLEIAKQYPVRVISQINKGLASARNTGIMNSYGDWIVFLDADDKLLPNCLKVISEEIRTTDYDIISPSFKEFGLSNKEVILMPNPTLEDFKTGNRIGYLSAIRRSALLEVGGYSPRMTEGYEDLALTVNLLTRGKKLVTIPDVLWMYRTKEVSMYTKITPEIHKKLLAQINKDFPEAQLNF